MIDTVANASGKALPANSKTSITALVADEEQARRRYVVFGAAGGALCQALYAIYNLSVGKRIEALFDISSVLLLVTTFFLTKNASIPHTRLGYQLGVFSLIYVNVYTLLFPMHATTAAIIGFLSVPVVLFYLLGLRAGMLWSAAVFAMLGIFLYFLFFFTETPPTTREITDIMVVFFVVSVFSLALEQVRQKTFAEYLISKVALTSATMQQKNIGGLVPICSSCSKIRNDNGFWQHLESYLVEHTPAHISNGICDACASADSTLKETASFRIPEALQLLYRWKDSEDKNKKKYFRLVIFTSAPMLLTYAIFNIFLGDALEAIGQSIVTVVLLTIAVVLPRTRHVQWPYHLAVALTFALFTFLFVTPSPDSTDHFWFFIIPLTACFVLGHRVGAIWSAATFAFALMVFTMPWFRIRYPYSTETMMFFSSTFILLTFFSVTIERVRKRYFDRILHIIQDLKQVYEGIRTLKGLVPVCRQCKSIRNDDGYWTRVDYYLYSHGHMMLSHGICPDCLKRDMPDVYEEMKAQGELE